MKIKMLAKILKLLKGKSGFTLIELMVVIIILGILATIVAPRLVGRTEQAQRTKALVQIRNLEAALELFKLDNGFYPAGEQGLQSLTEKPSTGKDAKRWREGGYLEKGKVPVDPWGNPFIYTCPGGEGREYDILSYGADGEPGGEGKNADVQSWNLDEDN